MQIHEQLAPEAANEPDIWGKITDQSIRFQGQWHDPETGLHYNRFRYYDPDVGRFIHQDPIGFGGGINWYQYAPNPTGWVDAFGLKGAYIFDVAMPGPSGPSIGTYIGKGPRSRFMASTRQRAGGAGAPRHMRSAHIDVKSPCKGKISDDDYAFMVESETFRKFAALQNINIILNSIASPGTAKLASAISNNTCPHLLAQLKIDLDTLLRKYLNTPYGAAR